MKLNRKWILVVALVLSLTMATAGTLAYLTDRDSEANVFTIGNVDIELNEEFTQDSALLPGVDIEKKPTIENVGPNDAWVWATIAIPAGLDTIEDASKNVIHFNFTTDSTADGYWNWQDEQGQWLVAEDVEHEGEIYNIYTVLYETPLKPGEETAYPVITKVYMDPHVDIDPDGNMYHVEAGVATDLGWNINENGAPVMHVSAYAMQTEGFDTVQEAYAAYTKQWTTTEGINNGLAWGVPGESDANATVYTAEELDAALAANSNITVAADIDAGETIVGEDADASVDLGNNTLTAAIVNNGALEISDGTLNSDVYGIDNRGDATLKDVVVNAGSTANYALISQGESELVLENVNLDSKGGGIGAANGAQVTFKSGSVVLNTASTSGRYLFYAEGEGSVITIEDGTFSFSKTLNQKRAYIYAGAGTTVYVKGGTFGPASTRSGYTAGILGSGTIVITGGTFGFDPSNWVPAGYQAVKSGSTWTVSAQ